MRHMPCRIKLTAASPMCRRERGLGVHEIYAMTTDDRNSTHILLAHQRPRVLARTAAWACRRGRSPALVPGWFRGQVSNEPIGSAGPIAALRATAFWEGVGIGVLGVIALAAVSIAFQ